MLCPGVFQSAALVDEIAMVLASGNLSEMGVQMARGASGGEEVGGGGSRLEVLVTLFSTAVPFGDYIGSCPTDLADLGLFSIMFDKWPTSKLMQQVSARLFVSRQLQKRGSAASWHMRPLLWRKGRRRQSASMTRRKTERGALVGPAAAAESRGSPRGSLGAALSSGRDSLPSPGSRDDPPTCPPSGANDVEAAGEASRGEGGKEPLPISSPDVLLGEAGRLDDAKHSLVG